MLFYSILRHLLTDFDDFFAGQNDHEVVTYKIDSRGITPMKLKKNVIINQSRQFFVYDFTFVFICKSVAGQYHCQQFLQFEVGFV